MTLHKYDKQPIFRNFPNAHPRISIFDNGINNEEERDKLLDIINSVTGKDHTVEKKSSSWYKYNDDELMKWVFENTNLAKTRFSTGSPPIWYGSENETNSLEEVLFHLKKNVKTDVQSLKRKYANEGKSFDLDYVENERAMIEAHIASEKFTDCTSLKNSIKNYTQISSYDSCIEEADKAQANGSDGLTYLSARSEDEITCVAVWNKSSIKSSKVKRFYSIIIYVDELKEEQVFKLPSK